MPIARESNRREMDQVPIDDVCMSQFLKSYMYMYTLQSRYRLGLTSKLQSSSI